ncbi:MAG: hypothetical protein AB7Q23_08745 [Hyphomonadaceae bacterium]
MAFLVNSAPRPGFRFEPSETFPDAKAALAHAVVLSRRGMREIRIRDTATGLVFDERGLRAYIIQVKAEAEASKAE